MPQPIIGPQPSAPTRGTTASKPDQFGLGALRPLLSQSDYARMRGTDPARPMSDEAYEKFKEAYTAYAVRHMTMKDRDTLSMRSQVRAAALKGAGKDDRTLGQKMRDEDNAIKFLERHLVNSSDTDGKTDTELRYMDPDDKLAIVAVIGQKFVRVAQENKVPASSLIPGAKAGGGKDEFGVTAGDPSSRIDPRFDPKQFINTTGIYSQNSFPRNTAATGQPNPDFPGTRPLSPTAPSRLEPASPGTAPTTRNGRLPAAPGVNGTSRSDGRTRRLVGKVPSDAPTQPQQFQVGQRVRVTKDDGPHKKGDILELQADGKWHRIPG